MKKYYWIVLLILAFLLLVRPTAPFLMEPQKVVLVDCTGKKVEIIGDDKKTFVDLLHNLLFLDRHVLHWFTPNTDWRFPNYARAEYFEITTVFGIRYRVYWWFEVGLILECSLTNTYAYLHGSSDERFEPFLKPCTR